MIKKYNLAYSILHFQIFLIDQYNKAYPTDLQCQTEPIYEYEGRFFMNNKNVNLIFCLFQEKN